MAAAWSSSGFVSVCGATGREIESRQVKGWYLLFYLKLTHVCTNSGIRDYKTQTK
jgi:hypothetical protein